jgi:coproporphyrinogen III oxidase-like Fe-S oxidoreductase
MRLHPSDGLQPQPKTGSRYLLYIHVPFCESLCPFCPFHRVVLDHDRARRYFGALRREIVSYRDAGFDFADVYVGGGTPTVMPEEVAETLNLIRRSFQVSTISIETNPNHLRTEILDLLLEAGVNRVSVGVQSLEAGLLKEMGRYAPYGSPAEILERLQAASGRFDTLNVDMIFNFPHQTMASLTRDLRQLKEIQVDQISYYPIMPASAAQRVISPQMGAVTFDRERAMYRTIQDILMPEYSPGTAWCFSRLPAAIDEYIVDHDEYLGIGSGSFSYLNGAIYASTMSIDRYIDLAGHGASAIEACRSLGLKEQLQYDFLMKLFGLSMDKEAMREKYGEAYRRLLQKELLMFKALGALRETQRDYRLTREGMYYWVLMMREFFTGVNGFRAQMRAGVQEHR